MSRPQPRLGRIGYLNVLPVYHPLEAGIIPHDFEIVSGPPALLNAMMERGELQISSGSCIEYARRPERYLLVPDMAIGSNGPVMSVLLLSRIPFAELGGHSICVSGESHTSVALLKLLLARQGVKARFESGLVSARLRGPEPPPAFLAIGDEALRLRDHPGYTQRLDLGEAWRAWTGLPFVFGLWFVSREAAEQKAFASDPAALLQAGRDWGLTNMDVILDLTRHGCPLTREELISYYRGLVYHMREEELEGLRLFYIRLHEAGLLEAVPALHFFRQPAG
ncbi:MAG: menaquinone biosynthesis protein [Deltaproteobacteria bacterium]|jgi:chorismate dehydratase|nr:menaquinone biosynthesis protein [Deltaproteobacteria bacterium]